MACKKQERSAYGGIFRGTTEIMPFKISKMSRRCDINWNDPLARPLSGEVSGSPKTLQKWRVFCGYSSKGEMLPGKIDIFLTYLPVTFLVVGVSSY